MYKRSNWQTHDWQNALKQSITSQHELLAHLGLQPPTIATEPPSHFGIRVPPNFLACIKHKDPQDPLLMQVLHTPYSKPLELFTAEPLKETCFSPEAGVIHKYPRRVLLITNRHCAINCRYCFRQNFPYEEHALNASELERIRVFLKQDSSLVEVILSGGDPLANSDKQLQRIISIIESIPHINFLRIHTRIPTCLPERITNELLNTLSATSLKVTVVLHINHAQEINHHASKAIELLHSTGIRLLNQSVLLQHVNHGLVDQIALCEQLAHHSIQAYYLHLLDKVSGAEHYLITKEAALVLHQQMRDTLPGHWVPQLVMEEPGKNSKTILN